MNQHLSLSSWVSTKVRIGCVLACLLAGSLLAPVSQADTVSDGQLWLNTTGIGKLGDNWRIWLEGQARFTDDAGRLGQSILRSGLGYALNDNLTLWAGHAYIVTDTAPGSDVDEQRFWQQATWTIGQLGKGTLSARSRLEQRWFSTGDDTAWRFRQFLRYTHPISADSRWYAAVTEEVFIALNSTDSGIDSGFDQNRLFVGVGYAASKGINLEAGYLNQYINTSTSVNAFNHILSLSMFARF